MENWYLSQESIGRHLEKKSSGSDNEEDGKEESSCHSLGTNVIRFRRVNMPSIREMDSSLFAETTPIRSNTNYQSG